MSLIVVMAGPIACAMAAPTDEELKAAAKEFVALLAKQDFAAAEKRFDATMTKLMPAKKLAAVWRSATGQIGAFQKQMDVRLQRVPNYRIALVACRFEKMILDIKVVFDPAGKVAGLFFLPNTSHVKYRPPKYADLSAIRERAVTVGTGKWALPGTLSVPKAGGAALPAVVLVHGSGPNDRDETVGAAKPFKDLALGLATKGLAVLRYDKRTKVHAHKLAAATEPLTVRQEVIDDCLAAAALLRKTPEVDPAGVFVLGHSLGGMLAPRIARRDAKLAGLIILAGPTRPLEDLLLAQTRYVVGLDGTVTSKERAQVEQIAAVVARIKDPKLSAKTPAKELMGTPASYWLDLRGYKPAETARLVPQPMLILQGGRDYQVTGEDLQGWKKHLAARKDVQFKLYPALDHLFIAGQGKSTPADYMKPGHVAGAVVRDIAAWVKAKRSQRTRRTQRAQGTD